MPCLVKRIRKLDTNIKFRLRYRGSFISVHPGRDNKFLLDLRLTGGAASRLGGK